MDPSSAEVERACENNVIRVEITVTDFMLTAVIKVEGINKNTLTCWCCGYCIKGGRYQ